MTVFLTADADIPLPLNPDEVAKYQYRERARAAIAVIKDMIAAGGEVEVTPEDRERARAVAVAVDDNESLKISSNNAGALLHLEALLTHYDHEFLNSVERLKRYVTNRLLEESNNDDPKIRLKALELLGKTSSVALFSDKVDVTVTHRTVDQIDAELAQLAEKYMGPVQVVENELDAEIEAELLELNAPQGAP